MPRSIVEQHIVYEERDHNTSFHVRATHVPSEYIGTATTVTLEDARTEAREALQYLLDNYWL